MDVQMRLDQAGKDGFALQINPLGLWPGQSERFLVGADQDKLAAIDGHRLHRGELFRVFRIGGQYFPVKETPVGIQTRRIGRG